MPQVSDEELCEFVDGQLEEPRRAEVSRAISENPDLAAKVASYKKQAEGLHALYDDVLEQPLPDKLLALVREARVDRAVTPSSSFQWRYAAAFLGVFITGLAGGWLTHSYWFSGPALLKAVVQQAVLARQMHEVALSQEQALGKAAAPFTVSAVSNPFPVSMRAPDSAGKFMPMSFRSASGVAGPTVQMLYRDDLGENVTLFVQAHSATQRVPYETANVDGFDVLYWLDGPLVYVLVGQKGEQQLLDLADSFYSAPGIRPASAEQ